MLRLVTPSTVPTTFWIALDTIAGGGTLVGPLGVWLMSVRLPPARTPAGGRAAARAGRGGVVVGGVGFWFGGGGVAAGGAAGGRHGGREGAQELVSHDRSPFPGGYGRTDTVKPMLRAVGSWPFSTPWRLPVSKVVSGSIVGCLAQSSRLRPTSGTSASEKTKWGATDPGRREASS